VSAACVANFIVLHHHGTIKAADKVQKTRWIEALRSVTLCRRPTSQLSAPSSSESWNALRAAMSAMMSVNGNTISCCARSIARPSSARRARGRTSSPHGQTTCSPVGWGEKRWVHEPINGCPAMTQYSIKRENLTASCLTRNLGMQSPKSRQAFGERSFICEGGARHLVTSLSPCCDCDILGFLLLVLDFVRLLDVPKVGLANGF
jgi:hypothetical protein